MPWVQPYKKDQRKKKKKKKERKRKKNKSITLELVSWLSGLRS